QFVILFMEVLLKAIACVKQVPDSAATVSVQNGRVTWGDAPLVLNPWDEYAVEIALQQTEAHGGDVTALTLGKEDEKEALKTAIAMGCKEAVRVSDPALGATDSQATAQILAAAIRKLGGADLITFGMQAIDNNSGVTAVQTARLLGIPVLTLVSKVVSLDLTTNTIVVERAIEDGKQVVQASLPVVLTFVKEVAEPRYPSFMGIRKAAKAEVKNLSLAELGISQPQSFVRWAEITNPPQKQIVTEIISGGSPEEIAENLADKIMAEKVL
ncbi:MAG: electron transfer flavoprotein subunit beta/FixA family protein, partial [Chloroflexota bacterium]